MIALLWAACGSGDDGHAAHMAATRDALRRDLGAAYDAPVPGLDAADPARGRATYESLCVTCHGPEGRGDGPAAAGLHPAPADFTSDHGAFYSDAGRVWIIERGSPGTAMPPFGSTLDRAQILDVYAYVRGLRRAGGHAH